MKLTIEIELGDNLQTFADILELQRREYASFADRNEPLAKGDSGPFFSLENGDTVGKWKVD